MDEARLEKIYGLQIKAALEELDKARDILTSQSGIEEAAKTASDKLKKNLVALRSSQKCLAKAILFRDQFVRAKAHRKFLKR